MRAARRALRCRTGPDTADRTVDRGLPGKPIRGRSGIGSQSIRIHCETTLQSKGITPDINSTPYAVRSCNIRRKHRYGRCVVYGASPSVTPTEQNYSTGGRRRSCNHYKHASTVQAWLHSTAAAFSCRHDTLTRPEVQTPLCARTASSSSRTRRPNVRKSPTVGAHKIY